MPDSELFNPSILSLGAAAIYLAVGAFCMALALRNRRRAGGAARAWAATGVVLLALTAWRITNAEHVLHDGFDAWAQTRGVYQNRHAVQIPVTIGLLAVLFGAVAALINARSLPRPMLALGSALALALLAALRVISLHAVDAVVHRHIGPVQLNFVLDLGIVAVVAMLAWREWSAGPARAAGTRRR